MVTFPCSRSADAGTSGVTGPSRAAFTGAAFLSSGTTQMISSDFRICLIDIEIADWGT